MVRGNGNAYCPKQAAPDFAHDMIKFLTQNLRSAKATLTIGEHTSIRSFCRWRRGICRRGVVIRQHEINACLVIVNFALPQCPWLSQPRPRLGGGGLVDLALLLLLLLPLLLSVALRRETVQVLLMAGARCWRRKGASVGRRRRITTGNAAAGRDRDARVRHGIFWS
jgi:hypothetical protein